MNVQGQFSFNKPGVFKRLSSRLQKQTSEGKLMRASWKLKDESRAAIEESFSSGTFDDQVGKFSEVISNLKEKEGARSLYAATVLGMRHLDELSDSPLIEVTAGANAAAERSVESALPSYLDELTDATVVGLETYRENPQGNPFELAGRLEDKVGWIASDMSPALEKIHPEVKSHLALYETIAADAEYHTGDTIRALGENPNRPLTLTLKEAIDMPRHYGDNESLPEIGGNVLSRLSYSDDDQLRALGFKSSNALDESSSREEFMNILEQNQL